jgi:hypothetical protein
MMQGRKEHAARDGSMIRAFIGTYGTPERRFQGELCRKVKNTCEDFPYHVPFIVVPKICAARVTSTKVIKK